MLGIRRPDRHALPLATSPTRRQRFTHPPPAGAGSFVAAFRAHKADRIVAEVNNGGEMVEATLRVIDPNLAFAPVYASHGKITRAEPVAALYEQGKVHHLGAFPQLEDQMCNLSREMHHDFGGRRARHSPDRVDALVWALTDLLLQPMLGEGIYEVYRRLNDQLSDTPHRQRPN